MTSGLIFALFCAAAAIVYGAVSVKWILGKSTGNERMQEISNAIQEGASAYLNRQYTTIGLAGVVLLVLIGTVHRLADRHRLSPSAPSSRAWPATSA